MRTEPAFWRAKFSNPSFLREYLDETYKNYIKMRRDKKPSIMAIRGVDYFSTHDQGRVTVHGYLRKFFLDECGKKPEDLDKDQVVTHLASSIHTAAVRLGRAKQGSDIVAKFAFCLSPEISRAWKAAGIDLDAGLRQIVDETLRRYRLGIMEGAELGYAVGIHHDKEHVHAHVYLMKRAANGKLLKLSNRLEAVPGKREEIRQQLRDAKSKGLPIPDNLLQHPLNLLINTANSVLREYQDTLSKSKFNVGNPHSLSADIERRINLATYDRIPASISA
jgi:hypothetical protein